MKNLMNSTFATSLAGLMFAAQIGCGEKIQQSEQINDLDFSVEAGVTAISGFADDQNGSSMARGDKPSPYQYAARALGHILPQAFAAQCSRAVLEPCVASGAQGVRTINYSACEIPFTSRSLSGSVALTYSNAACSMGVGESVNRSYDVTISGPYGGQLAISSATHNDYRGNTLGGGGTLSQTGANSWQISVAGRHHVLSFRGRTLADVSLRTTSPINVQGTLARSARVVDGGALEVIHNLAGFTATYQPSNLAWSNLCCHPVSGTLNVTYQGSVSGTGSVQFNGCGSATLTKNGESRNVSLNYCE